jgi:hypothetical protein
MSFIIDKIERREEWIHSLKYLITI